MNERAQQRKMLEADLRRALDAESFELYYQPMIDLASGGVCGFEALIRWNHPERGLVGPLEFIAVAEEIGLIIPIGKWVLREACKQAALWPHSVKVAVNLSPVQFKSDRLFQDVVAALSSSGLSPHRLELEITESVILMDSKVNLELLKKMRTLGVQISLDDFGTGYSSLSYLRLFPFNKIKIDRSFVGDLEANPDCLAIIRAVSRLASDLGMKTIAEGIETQWQLDQLRAEGCHEGQGYLFSRPVPADQTISLIGLLLRASIAA
jgi:EAL domain-containing protein (putative c-di-GMP-specific phosphodiesterase class I)